MNFQRFIAAVLRPVRMLMIAFACAVMLFANSSPALAISSPPTNPAGKGEPPLQGIFEKSEDALKSDDYLNADKVIEESNKGLNEVQGAADINQMYRPETSQKAVSAEEQVERALEKITDKFPGKD
jgi:hypothetical protein